MYLSRTSRLPLDTFFDLTYLPLSYLFPHELFADSEGGYGAAAGAMGLSCIGVEVKRLQMGAAPFSLANEQFVRGHDNMKKELFPADQHYYLALIGAPFSTFTPNWQLKSCWETSNSLQAQALRLRLMTPSRLPLKEIVPE